MCQLPGHCLAMGVKAFTRLLAHDRRAAALFTDYTDFVLASAFRNIGCMRFHDVGSRCARWLLVTQDRTNSHNLPYTHNMLAQMLGVTRPRATTVVWELQRDGLIQSRRGSITLMNREGLEKRACSCYEYVDRLRTQRLARRRSGIGPRSSRPVRA
jgi:CRP-like cAMP-binding protein